MPKRSKADRGRDDLLELAQELEAAGVISDVDLMEVESAADEKMDLPVMVWQLLQLVKEAR